MTMLADGTYTEVVPDGTDDVIKAITAAGSDALLFPPREWFQNPDLDKPTPIAVTSDGRIYGHIAPWGTQHTGMPGVTAPRSPSNYAFFKTGVVVTKEGDEVPVGQVTLAGGHCNDLTASAGDAVKHYDDTASAVADVNVGEDQHGIWIAGSLRPQVTPEQIRALRASAPSGDWRPINGAHELVAVCQVNHPGFPVARTLVASGKVLAIVAAGASAMYALRQQEVVIAAMQDMDNRITRLEDRIASQNALTASVESVELTGAPATAGQVVFNINAGGRQSGTPADPS
jgi:hypothetical protein